MGRERAVMVRSVESKKNRQKLPPDMKKGCSIIGNPMIKVFKAYVARFIFPERVFYWAAVLYN